MEVTKITIRQTKVELDNSELTEAVLDYIGKKLNVDAKSASAYLFFRNIQKDPSESKAYAVVVDFSSTNNKEGVFNTK